MISRSTEAEVAAHDAQREQSPWITLLAIWRGKYPSEAPRPSSFSIVVKLAVTPILVFRRLSPSTFLRNCGPDAIDLMVIGWSLVTTLILITPSLRGSNQAFVAPWVAAIYSWFRLSDITSQKLMEVLVHSVRPPLQVSIQRAVILSAINVYEIICSYAVLYLINGGVQHDGAALSTASAAFYFSTVTALTVGYGDFVPVTDTARRLVVSEIAVIAIFIVTWFPVAVALLFPRRMNQ